MKYVIPDCNALTAPLNLLYVLQNLEMWAEFWQGRIIVYPPIQFWTTITDNTIYLTIITNYDKVFISWGINIFW